MTCETVPQRRLWTLHRRTNVTLLIKLLAAATTYGFSVLAARTMGVDAFGQVAVFLSASLFLSVVGSAGQQTAALRFIPPLLDGERHRVDAFTPWAFARACKVTLWLFVVTLAAGLWAVMSGWLDGFSASAMTLGLVLVPLVGLVDFQSHVARGFHLLPLSLIPKEILWRAIAGSGILGLWWLRNSEPLNAEPVLWLLLLSLGIIATGQWKILKRQTGVRFRKVDDLAPAPEWHSASTPFWISSVSNIFLANADTITVGLLVGPKSAGVYFVANRLAMLLSFFQTSHNVVLGPMLASEWQTRGAASVGPLIRHAAQRMTVPTVLMGLALAGFAPLALSLFGTEFAQGALSLRLLILAGIINAALGPGDIALNMCGFHRRAMVASAWLLAINAPVLVIGALLGGASGVAMAVLLATILRKLVFWGLTLRHMSIRSDALAPGSQP